MTELILLILLAIITGKLLNRRYKVASIAHSVLFFVLIFLYLFTVDVEWLKYVMCYWIGEKYYNSLHDALEFSVQIVNGGLSAILVIEFVLFIILPLFSIIVFINEIRKQFKELKIDRHNIVLFFKSLITLVLDPNKDFKHTENETYLILGKLLN